MSDQNNNVWQLAMNEAVDIANEYGTFGRELADEFVGLTLAIAKENIYKQMAETINVAKLLTDYLKEEETYLGRRLWTAGPSETR